MHHSNNFRYRKGVSKHKSEGLHARKRALERYQLDLGKTDLEIIVNKIQNGEGRFIEKVSNRITHWLIEINSRRVIVAYDKMRKQVITFLPANSEDLKCGC